MGNITTNARAAAIITFLLALPGVVLFSMLVLHIEPDFGALEPLLNNPDPDQPDVLASLLVLSMMLLVLVAFIINFGIIVGAARAGKRITAHPLNLVLALFTFAFVTSFVGGIILDQYPCWIGVPNCD